MADWAPAVDISEDDKEFLVKAELPGLKREEVKVTVENGVLSIAGERLPISCPSKRRLPMARSKAPSGDGPLFDDASGRDTEAAPNEGRLAHPRKLGWMPVAVVGGLVAAGLWGAWVTKNVLSSADLPPMAKVQLAFGRDDKIKKLSEEIIKAQEAEIAMMKDWLAKNAR